MTPAAAVKALARAAEITQAEQLAVVRVYIVADYISIELAPAEFVLFVRRHRLVRRVRSYSFIVGKVHCMVPFGRGLHICTDVKSPAQLPGLNVEFPAIEASPSWCVLPAWDDEANPQTTTALVRR